VLLRDAERGRHLVLTLVSYIFYGWWSPWFTLLMLGSTAVDYVCGGVIARNGAGDGMRRAALWTSVVANLGALAFFKYAVFFAENANALLWFGGLGGWEMLAFLTQVVLPVGISFYTFQSMSYSIDLYRGHARPARSFVEFACYVSMFPQLVAGPIVRYGSVAEQLRARRHTVEGFVEGFTRFNFGFAKKILIANPAGNIADLCFSAGEGSLGPLAAWVGVTAFAFQIYFDFSGYSDMAIGLGRMFGFRFPENFRAPYRSTSITDFWRRWHISLSGFLRDYLYIPLGGNRRGRGRTAVNLMAVMLIGGLWHGAQWTFVIWGGIHGVMLAVERALGRDAWNSRLPGPIRVAITFVVLLVSWVFFRSESLEVALRYVGALFGGGEWSPTASLLRGMVLTPANVVVLVAAALTTWVLPGTKAFLSRITVSKVLLGMILLFVSVRAMFLQGFNPFLYFQF